MDIHPGDSWPYIKILKESALGDLWLKNVSLILACHHTFYWYFLCFNNFVSVWIFIVFGFHKTASSWDKLCNQSTVDDGGVNRGRISGCGCCCYWQVTRDMWQSTIRNVRLSVLFCAIVETQIPGGMETSGQRAYFLYWPATTHFLLLLFL